MENRIRFQNVFFFLIMMWMTIEPTTLLATESVEPAVKEMSSVVDTVPPPPESGGSFKVEALTSLEFYLSFIVLSFGVIVFVIEFACIRKVAFGPEESIKLVAVTLIIVSTLFIISAGFGSEEIAPAMGLFGTIAGYILGRTGSEKGGKDK